MQRKNVRLKSLVGGTDAQTQKKRRGVVVMSRRTSEAIAKRNEFIVQRIYDLKAEHPF